MRDFDLQQSIQILDKTPKVLHEWLSALPDSWVRYKPDTDEWSAYDIVGHLIHGEKTDWIPRTRLILESTVIEEFDPFDRFAQFREDPDRSMDDLLCEFADLREGNLRILTDFDLKPADYGKKGKHPDLGLVNLQQLLSTWVVHDLEHLGQIAKVMAARYANLVGPWSAYLGILTRRSAR